MLVELIFAFVLLLAISRSFWAIGCIVGVVLWMLGHAKLCQVRFGGITGDLAGFFISITELLVLFIAVIGGLCT